LKGKGKRGALEKKKEPREILPKKEGGSLKLRKTRKILIPFRRKKKGGEGL